MRRGRTLSVVATVVSMDGKMEYATAVRLGFLGVVWMAACWVGQKG